MTSWLASGTLSKPYMYNGDIVSEIQADKELRMALVGPVSPYRGGISQYTMQLKEALAKKCELYTYSFKRLYPQWLYPGESDKEPGTTKWLPDVNYSLDVYNPSSLRKTVAAIVAKQCQVAVFDWWTLIWQPGIAYMARQLSKRGVKAIFLCHNLFDHDAKGVKRRISEKLLAQADAYIVHSQEGAARLHTLRPGSLVLQRLHPIYSRFPKSNEILPKRGDLELLFFGLVRPYKGLDVLVAALGKLQDRAIYLTVAGEVWGDNSILRHQLESSHAPNIELHLSYVDDMTAASYFARADVVVLPYRTATGSGVLSLAYTYKRPVLASRVGGLMDSVIEGKTGWLVDAASPDALANAIKNITREQTAEMADAITAFCQKNSWQAMAAEVCKFAQSLLV